MRVIISISYLFIFIFCLSYPNHSAHATPDTNYMIGTILSIQEKKISNQPSEIEVKVRIDSEQEKNQILSITQEQPPETTTQYKKNTQVIIGVLENATSQNKIYFIQDTYRLNWIIGVIIGFLGVILIVNRWNGLRSIFGLGVSILIITYGIVPLIGRGYNPITISIIGAIGISIVSIYLAHGIKKRTTLALVSMIASFTIATLCAWAMVTLTKLFGLGSEEAGFLIGDATHAINLRGLLLGGIIIGMLGVLDDITTAQTAAIEELSKANSTLTTKQLYKQGMSIGKEHITSLVNTLALAYAGSSMPMFLLFTINAKDPFWITINSEFIAEEIVRTIAGSVALILAVPITTFFAARSFGEKTKK